MQGRFGICCKTLKRLLQQRVRFFLRGDGDARAFGEVADDDALLLKLLAGQPDEVCLAGDSTENFLGAGALLLHLGDTSGEFIASR